MTVRVEHADCRDAIKALADCSVDSCVTDPPYSLVSIQKRFGKPGSAPAKDRDGLYRRASAGFMGQQWDTGETAFDPAWWAEVYRVLKPGAHLVAFSGTRTYHRMACAIEDAGFEIRDMLSWNYGSGFPKSHSLRAIGRPELGTALKPAQEPICLARKPLAGTVAANVQQHGTGALNIDGCRIGTDGGTRGATKGPQGNVYGDGLNGAFGEIVPGLGRWPANLLHDGSDEVLAEFAKYGERQGGGAINVSGGDERSVYGRSLHTVPKPAIGDSGSAARFFFSAKAGSDDRMGTSHPTTKPTALLRWLTRLITPPGGLVMDPFGGSGTTAVACIREGFDCIIIEREAQYVEMIKKRLAHLRGDDTPLFSPPRRQAGLL